MCRVPGLQWSRNEMGKNNLEQLREEMGLDQNEAAKLLRMTPSTLCKYEHGKISMRQDVLEKFADFYKVPIEYITGATDNRIPYSKMDPYNNDIAKKEMGAYLNALIRKKGLSIRTLASRSNMKYSYIGHITSGDYPLTMEKAREIVRAMDLSRDETLSLYDRVAEARPGSVPADVADLILTHRPVLELVRRIETFDDPDDAARRLMEYADAIDNAVTGAKATFEYDTSHNKTAGDEAGTQGLGPLRSQDTLDNAGES